MDTDAGRGVVILAHSSIQHLIIDVNRSINHINFNEACMVEVRLSGNDLHASTAAKPKSDTSTENNNELNCLIKDIASTKKYSHKCFVGDFNFPTINWKNWTTPHLQESKEEKFLEVHSFTRT